MKFFIVDDKVVTNRTHSEELAYKNLIFEDIKTARDFLKLVKQSPYGELGMTSIENKRIEEILAEESVPIFENSIKEKNELLKKYYPNGFENSDEWEMRKKLNFIWFTYKNLSILQRLHLKEDALYKYFLRSGRRTFPIRTPLYLIEGGKAFMGPDKKWIFNTKESSELRDKHYPLIYEYEKLEYESRLKFYDYHKNTELDNKQLSKVKDLLILELDRLNKVQKDLFLYKTFHLGLSPLDDTVKVKKVKDLTIDEIKFNPDIGYNIIHIRKSEPLKIYLIGQMGDRNVLMSEKGDLLKNEDFVAVNYNTNFSSISLNNLTFYNENQLYY